MDTEKVAQAVEERRRFHQRRLEQYGEMHARGWNDESYLRAIRELESRVEAFEHHVARFRPISPGPGRYSLEKSARVSKAAAMFLDLILPPDACRSPSFRSPCHRGRTTMSLSSGR